MLIYIISFITDNTKIKIEPFINSDLPSIIYIQYYDSEHINFIKTRYYLNQEFTKRHITMYYNYEYKDPDTLYQYTDKPDKFIKLRIPYPKGTAYFNVDPTNIETTASMTVNDILSFNNPKFPSLILYMNPNSSLPEMNKLLYKGSEHPFIARLRSELIKAAGMSLYVIPSIDLLYSFGFPTDWNTNKYVRYDNPTYGKDPYQGIVLIPKGDMASDYFIAKYSYPGIVCTEPPSCLDQKGGPLPSILTLNSKNINPTAYLNFRNSIINFKVNALSIIPKEGEVFISNDNAKYNLYYTVYKGQKIHLRPNQNDTINVIKEWKGNEPYKLDLKYTDGYYFNTDSNMITGYYPKCELPNGSIYLEANPASYFGRYAYSQNQLVKINNQLYYTDHKVWYIKDEEKLPVPFYVFGSNYAAGNYIPIASTTKLDACPVGPPAPTCSNLNNRLYKCDSAYSESYRQIQNGVAYRISADQYSKAGSPSWYSTESCMFIDRICRQGYYDSCNMIMLNTQPDTGNFYNINIANADSIFGRSNIGNTAVDEGLIGGIKTQGNDNTSIENDSNQNIPMYNTSSFSELF